MLAQEIIRRKRNRETLSGEEIAFFARGMAIGSIAEGQVAAFAMAVFLNGLEPSETVALTLAMRDSGDVLDWSDLPGPVTDKHSTGGVGDNVSLMLAPIVAACGAFVPMISGRGLGHTGGTLDKMDSIPGYKSQPDIAVFRKVVREAGCAIIGQTSDLAPADRRFYAIRDVTGTVESVPLITASILSKKLAAGLGSLVLDVKAGSGAFMPTREKAGELARSLVKVANGAGLRATALLTDMNEPLASAAGNAVEVANAVRFLTGEARDRRLEEVVMALAAEMLYVSGRADTNQEAFERARDALDSGRAAEHFSRMVHALGGPADFMERWRDHLQQAKVEKPVAAPRDGFVSSIATREIGLVVVELGGGRHKADDTVDHSVGVTRIAPVGTSIKAGEPLAFVHARSDADAERAVAAILKAIKLRDEPADAGPTVLDRVAPTLG